ncbi:hypothetical protein BsWGS_22461 [Bradybaena similaris]
MGWDGMEQKNMAHADRYKVVLCKETHARTHGCGGGDGSADYGDRDDNGVDDTAGDGVDDDEDGDCDNDDDHDNDAADDGYDDDDDDNHGDTAADGDDAAYDGKDNDENVKILMVRMAMKMMKVGMVVRMMLMGRKMMMTHLRNSNSAGITLCNCTTDSI